MSISDVSAIIAKPFQDAGNCSTQRRVIGGLASAAAVVPTSVIGAPLTAITAFVGGVEGGVKAFSPNSATKSFVTRDFIVPTVNLRGTAQAVVLGGVAASAASYFPATANLLSSIGIDVGNTFASGAVAGLLTAVGWNSLVGTIKGAIDGAAGWYGMSKGLGCAAQVVANNALPFAKKVENNLDRDAHLIAEGGARVVEGAGYLVGKLGDAISEVGHGTQKVASKEADKLDAGAPKRQSYTE